MDYMEWSAGYFNSTRPGDVTVSFDPKRRASKYSTDDFFGGVTYEIDLTKPYGRSDYKSQVQQWVSVLKKTIR